MSRSSKLNSAKLNSASGNSSADPRSLRERMSQDLRLKGMAKRTHDGYLREIRKLACHYNTPPDQLSQQQVGDYLLYLVNDCQFAPGSLKVTYSGLKFFYSITCPRDWNVLKKLRVPKQKTLPDVLTIGEVQQLIAATKQHHNAAFFWTAYTLGLRLEEGLNLQVGDLDSQRMMIHIHRGKGAKDRFLPLPQSTLQILRANPRACYQALFDCGRQTINELASGKRFVGTDRLGFFSALHTWGRDFTVYNPHVHFVVPGGGVSADGSKWMACPKNFLLPEKAASAVFPGKFRDAMRQAGLEDAFKSTDAQAWLGKWTVDVEPVGNGKAALKYLAPYVYRVAISNNRIESVGATHVRFRYTPSGTKAPKQRTVTGKEFVRGFLQHTLPSRFQRIRYYGFASQNSKLKFAWVQMLVWFYLGWCYLLKKQTPPQSTRQTAGPVPQVQRRNAAGGGDRPRWPGGLPTIATQPCFRVSRFRMSYRVVWKPAEPKPLFCENVCNEVP